MNLSVLLGRLVHEPELQKKEKDDSTTYWCKFRIAVDREYTKGQETDFFNCIAYGGRARYLVSYAKKGGRLVVVGRLQTGSYQKNDGTKSYFTEQNPILQNWLWQIVRSLILQIVRIRILKKRRKIRYEI